MYNLFQYINKRHSIQQEQKRIEEQSQFSLRHQEFKKTAFQNMKNRAQEFLFNQSTTEKPFTFQDDHHQRWRRHRLYRDVEDASHFKGFKTFRHRPNEDMDKFYTSRERKEIQELAIGNKELVESGILPKEQLSRSLRSQGPYHPKIEFRISKKDEQYLQPRLRFQNVTDKQRISESSMSFDERVGKIYSRFQESKSKLGKTMKESMNRYDDSTSSGTHRGFSDKKKGLSLQRRSSREEQPEESLINSTKLSQYFEERGQARRKSKSYFKLSKTMQMFHPSRQKRQEFQQLLKNSQFDRQKNLSNIRSNVHNENYKKSPIM